jgi:hypothetical protein
MDRRGFLRLMGGGVATAAAARTFPFRVFSFPTQILTAAGLDLGEYSDYSPINLSFELLQDSAFNLEAFIAEEFARRVAFYQSLSVHDHSLLA